MYDYSRLPTLVLNEIFGYLSVKERIKAKSVCRTWREEIELRERKSDTLVLHFGPYLWNVHWTETNNRRLMKFENSFEVKRLTFLEHPLTRELLERTKKLAIVYFCRNDYVQDVSHLQPYLGYFGHCEEIELRGLRLEGTLTFKLPKLKVLVFNNCSPNKLVLNCPSLEVLFWDQKILEIDFRSATKLKRLICFGWPAKVSLKGKLQSLEYLNFYAAQREPVNDRLLDWMPKLKRLVIYSGDPQADLESIRQQQKRLDRKNLEVLFSGFLEPVGFELGPATNPIVYIDQRVDQLFENYSKLAESSPWKVSIDYTNLFNKFKILPSDFFERFSEPFLSNLLEVSA